MTKYYAADLTEVDAVLFANINDYSEVLEFTINGFRIIPEEEREEDGPVAELYDDVTGYWVPVECPEYIVKGENKFFVVATEVFEGEYEPKRD